MKFDICYGLYQIERSLIQEQSIEMQSGELWDSFRSLFNLRLDFGNGKPHSWHVDIDSRKLTFSYLVTFSCRAMPWQSNLMKDDGLSTIEAKFIIATDVSK